MTKAASALIAHKATIDAMIARLACASANHFGASPENANWGDVGSAEELARVLTDAVRFMNA